MSDEWAGLLDPDERIIWQGAPKIRVRLEWTRAMDIVGMLFLAGFSILWWFGTSNAGPGLTQVIGVLLLCAVFYQVVLVHFWKAYQRKYIHYTLSNKRAFIATQGLLKGKRLDSYPINDTTPITFIDGTLSTIHFATRAGKSDESEKVVPVGFEELANGRDVYALMRQVQEGTA